MTRSVPNAGTTFRFDTNRYRFVELALSAVRTVLGDQGHEFAELQNLGRFVESSRIGAVYAALYRMMDGAEFVQTYKEFLISEVLERFPEGSLVQRKPGIRIHLPDTRTVQYHTDEWYGHGRDVRNFWIPLTPSVDSASLYVATLADSNREIRSLEDERASMQLINERLAKIARPLRLDFGDAYIFTAQCVHGSEINVTGQTRLSIDFRVLPPGTERGTKPATYYFDPRLSTVASNHVDTRRKACVYVFPAGGFTRHINTQQQRAVCNDFASVQKIDVVSDETEIRTMQHHPTLVALASGAGTHSFDVVLAFSVLCLPDDAADRATIYANARRSRTALLFAVEGLEFPTSADEAEIERTRTALL